MYQQITIAGNVGGEVVMRHTPSGKAVTNFNVAVNEKMGDKETVTWFKCTAWDKTAEIANQYLTKGKGVLIVGRVEVEPYLTKTNEAAASMKVTVNTLRFLGGNGKPDTVATGDGNTIDESDIPF